MADTGIDITNLIMVIIACFGIVANILCTCVLFRKRMKSSFNTILLGLTLFDLLLLLKTVFSSTNKLTNYSWPLNQSTWAPQMFFFLSWFCDGGTKYFTVAVSLERYIAICHPLKARSWMTTTRSRIFAGSVAAYVALLSGVNFYLRFYSDGMILTLNQVEVEKAILLNFGPFLTICLLNIGIYLTLQRSQKMKKKTSQVSNSATRMLLTVVLVFGVCYSFEATRRIISYFVVLDLQNNTFHYVLSILADIFYVVNSSVNFIIYYLLGKRFRSEFLDMLSCGNEGCCGFNKGKITKTEEKSDTNHTSLSTVPSSESNTTCSNNCLH